MAVSYPGQKLGGSVAPWRGAGRAAHSGQVTGERHNEARGVAALDGRGLSLGQRAAEKKGSRPVMDRWRALSETVRDAVGAVPIVLAVQVEILSDGGTTGPAVAVAIVMSLALTFRRRWPLVTFLAALLTVAIATTGLEFLIVASYTFVAYRPRAHTVVVAGVSAIATTVGFMRWRSELVMDDLLSDFIVVAAVSILPAALGRAVREARARAAELDARNSELVTLREEAFRHAAEAERFRIARELHDVLGHYISAVTVRARAAHHVASRDPQAATDALGYVAEMGSESLKAMRALVGALRTEEVSSGPSELLPQPGLADIPRLVESFRGVGLVVYADVDDAAQRLPSTLGLHTYRIVQEALTNALSHGAAARAWLRISIDSDILHIQLDDDGQGLAPSSPRLGHGLAGIAERVALHRGASALGPSPQGGCRMEASMSIGHRNQMEHPQLASRGVTR